MKERLLDAVKGAVELNLRYSSVILNLSKEYIREFDRIVREGPPQQTERATTTEAKPAPGRRPPILLVGQLHDEATGAFMLNNTAGVDLHVNLVVQGELDANQVQVTPSSLVLTQGANAFVRLRVKLTDALQEGRDYVGAVLAPGLSAQAIEFVVHRLPGAAASLDNGGAGEGGAGEPVQRKAGRRRSEAKRAQ